MTTPNVRTPRVAAEANADQDNGRADSATAERERVAATDRRVRALQRALAERGFTLHVVDGEARFIVQRWCLTRSCADLAEVERFCAQVTGRPFTYETKGEMR